MNWLNLILKYLAMALQVITVIQTVIPTAPGSAKNAVAVAMLNPPEADKAQVSNLVTSLTGAMVAGGAWVKDQAPANPPAAPKA